MFILSPSPAGIAEDVESLLPDSIPHPTEAEPALRRYSVFHEGEHEAMRFKWIESEKAGFDLGEQALHHWARRHWPGFLRACWLEHLLGRRYWIEVDRGDFGLLARGRHDHPTLLAKIVRMLQAGQENLDVIIWAQDAGAPMETVLRILETLDVNSRRLAPRFGS